MPATSGESTAPARVSPGRYRRHAPAVGHSENRALPRSRWGRLVLTRVLLRAASSRHGLLRSRRFCLRRPRGTPHEIDETERVGRLRVAAPGDMLVRAHQHELAAIDLRASRDLTSRTASGRPRCAAAATRSAGNVTLAVPTPIGMMRPGGRGNWATSATYASFASRLSIGGNRTSYM
jgi:hypothetical protein